jgi:DNA-binding response OmpR family regulator
LTSIKGYVDLMLDGEVGGRTEEQQEFLGVVGNNANRLVALIADLLDVARIEAGRVELRRVAIDLPRLTRSVAESFRPQLEAKGQRLDLDLPADLPTVVGDPDRVTQILTNLVSNAHKYTPPGGQITVAAEPAGERVRVDVRDNGIGLSPDEQEQLFTRFYRANNRTTQEVGGSGLGLSITRSLVQMHGGDVVVTSAPGQGSTFSFTLPAAPAAPEANPAALPLRPGGRILVVDDEPDIAALIRRYLERAGYGVLVAHTAADGLRLARQERPDLVTLDVLLPDADGFTLLDWLKRDVATTTIPVMMLSVLPDEGDDRRVGAVDYVTKPVREEALLKRISRILGPSERSAPVLVADDDADTRRLVAGHLRRAGYDVLEAADGAEAVILARQQRPGLALLDIRMPFMDGVAALRALRANDATRDIPIVMMTASPGALEETRSAIETLGGLALSNKPLTAEEVAMVIARVLPSLSVEKPSAESSSHGPIASDPASFRARPAEPRPAEPRAAEEISA